MAAYDGWKVGDYAIRKNRLCQVLKIHFDEYPPHVTVRMLDDDNEIGTEFEKIRHATPEEIETMKPPELIPGGETKGHDNPDAVNDNTNSTTSSNVTTPTATSTTANTDTNTTTIINKNNDSDNHTDNGEVEATISKLKHMHLDNHKHEKNNYQGKNNDINNIKINNKNKINEKHVSKHDIIHDKHDAPHHIKSTEPHDSEDSESREEHHPIKTPEKKHEHRHQIKTTGNKPKTTSSSMKQKTPPAPSRSTIDPQLKKRRTKPDNVPTSSIRRSPFLFDSAWDDWLEF